MKSTLRSVILIFCVSVISACVMFQEKSLFPSKPTDQSITQEVKRQFAASELLEPFKLRVETKDGTVYLSGYVKTIRQSDTAGEIAGQVPGVQFVQNEIVVRK